MNMAQKIISVWLVTIFLGASQLAVEAQEIRVESALVAVPTIVSNAQGQFIPGLTADSFKLFQDGEEEKISLFLTSDDPCKIVLMLDTSKSTTSVLGNIKKAARRFLLQMRSQDMAMIVGFDTDIRVLCRFSSNRNELEEAIDRAKSSGLNTRLRDAIFDVENRLRSIAGRKAIVLLTDGDDHGSAVSAEELRNVVLSSGALIYSVFYHIDMQELMKEIFGLPPIRTKEPDPDWVKQEKEAAQYLQEVSELSAGRFYRSKVTEFDRAFKQISDELHSQYLLGFYPNELKLDEKLHSLVVQVHTPGAVVRSRRKYRSAENH
jgi:Ca-activated chloride channel homolog